MDFCVVFGHSIKLKLSKMLFSLMLNHKHRFHIFMVKCQPCLDPINAREGREDNWRGKLGSAS